MKNDIQQLFLDRTAGFGSNQITLENMGKGDKTAHFLTKKGSDGLSVGGVGWYQAEAEKGGIKMEHNPTLFGKKGVSCGKGQKRSMKKGARHSPKNPIRPS